MHKEKLIPPKLPLRFFRWFCHPKLRDHIEGDLLEVYGDRLKKLGKRKADIKFIIDVLLLFRPGIIRPTEGYKTLNNYGMIKSYFKIGWRNLVRNKGYSIINIGGLAIGISVAMLIGLWIYDELSFDHQNKNYDRIAQVEQNITNNGEVQTWTVVPFPLAEELRTNYGNDFKHVALAAQWGDHVLSFNDKILNKTGVYFEKDAPEILGINLLRGSASLTDPSSILLSSSTAKTYFGESDPVNQVMKIDNMPLVKVGGVYQDFPGNSRFAGLNFIASWDFYYNNTEWIRTAVDPWRPNFCMLFVELKDHADFNTVSAKIKDVRLKKINEELAKSKPALFLHPMSQWHLYSEFKNGVKAGGAIQYVWLFGVIGIFVLLLACINFMNLSTARSERRAKEVGIRKTIGSVKKQLIVQFFSESFLTVLLAFALALIIIRLALPFFNQIANKQMEIVWGNPFLWIVSFGFIVLTSLIAGSYPAFYLSSFNPVKVLKGTFNASRFASVPRKVLVTLQFTVSITLIIGTIIIYQQIQFAKDRPVGYSRENLIRVQIRNSSIHDHFEAVKSELIQTRIITAISESQSPTTAIWNSTSRFSWQGKDPNVSVNFGVVEASVDFGKTIGWQIKEGRGFSKDFVTDSSAVILNEAAVTIMNIKNPIGQTLTGFGQTFTIIGVVHNMLMESPYDEMRPVVYAELGGQGSLVLLKINSATSAKDALTKIEAVFKKFNPESPFEYQFVDNEFEAKFGNEERIGTLASIFAILAIFISCLGLFGLSSFVAEQRTKEIGIRKVMGASIFNLWKMLSKDFVVLVIISVFISIPIAFYFMNSWLQKYTYHTEITWWVFVAAGIGALTITFLTVSYQYIRAALANPVNNLRS